MVKFSPTHSITQKLLVIALTIFSTLINAEENNSGKIASIIIDDLGNNLEYGKDVIEIPDALTIAVLPRAHFSKQLARLATQYNKEVMLHLPMQSVTHHQYTPGMLNLHMTRASFKRQLALNLDSIPHVRGVNNHMGSLLTRHPGHMTWLMDELSQRGNLYFIDSKTTSKSVADKIAQEHNVPTLSRDYFLDPDDNESTLRQQFDYFVSKVNERGYAIAIAHPYPKTIKFLQENLNELNQHGIRLVPVSNLVEEVTLIKEATFTRNAKLITSLKKHDDPN